MIDQAAVAHVWLSFQLDAHRPFNALRISAVLLLNDNGLTGEIPSELGQLTKLTTLLLQGNELSGMVPSEVGELTLLETIRIEMNPLLTGRVPSEVCDLRSFVLDTFTVDCPTREEAPICAIPSCCTSCNPLPPSPGFLARAGIFNTEPKEP